MEILIGDLSNRVSTILGGLTGLHFLIILYGFFLVWSSSNTTSTKVIWSLIIFFLPFVGILLYLFLGANSLRKAS